MMIKFIFRILTILFLVGLLVLAPAEGGVQAAPLALSDNVVFNLYATDGFVRLADGNTAYIYGFVGGRKGQTLNYMTSALSKKVPETLASLPDAPDPTGGIITATERPLAGNAQFPAPLISAAVGDVVEIRLKNLGVNANPKAPNDPHSIHLHGLDVDAANDGVPETSLGAVPANSGLPGAGNVVVYMFSPTYPGTYMYHCHQEASIHVAMGMYGALVVYNSGEAGASDGPGAGGGNLFGYDYSKDYVVLLSDMDLNQNRAEQQASAFNNINYKPQYWMINGLSFPSTIHVAPPGVLNPATWWNDWITAHPGYDPFIQGSVGAGDKVLLRMINMGFQAHPMHMHGFHGKIIGSDQRGWAFSQGQIEKNTLLIGSGETYEWLLDFSEQSRAYSIYPEDTQSRFNANGPSSNTSGDPAIPDPFTPGQTYIGGPTVVGAVGHPDLGQYFPFHNHNDYQATNNGVYPGGMFTMIMTKD